MSCPSDEVIYDADIEIVWEPGRLRVPPPPAPAEPRQEHTREIPVELLPSLVMAAMFDPAVGTAANTPSVKKVSLGTATPRELRLRAVRASLPTREIPAEILETLVKEMREA